jgi:starch-binding outer membrane protein, SusD/RagB family
MKKIFYTILTSVLLVAGCRNDLDIVNPNEATIEVFWQNAVDAEQGVNAIYSTFKREGTSRWMPMLYIIRSDEGLSSSPWPELQNTIDKFIQTDYNFVVTSVVWRDLYVGVFRANQVLDNVPGIEMDEALKARLMGEALFLRAYMYYNLASLWGNVPLMLATSLPTDLPPTSSQNVVWEQIARDLTNAATMLPASYPNPNDLGRVTKGAAHALLGKVYMQQRRFDMAVEALNWLVTGEGRSVYSLTPNYRDNFLINRENNVESVFEWQFTENLEERTDNDISDIPHNHGSSIAQFLAPPQIGFSDGEAHRWVVREFNRERTTGGARDPRVDASFLFDSTDVRGPNFSRVYGQTFSQRFAGPPNSTRVWFRKFQNDHWKNQEGFRSPNNWRVIRYADVLLMYAESLNEVGRTAEAYPHVDRVRQRVGLAPLSAAMPGLNQTQFREQIKHERLLELSGEGHRWNDLARWGDLGPQLANRDPAFANFQVGRHELLPIPQIDLDINPNMTQNPNW